MFASKVEMFISVIIDTPTGVDGKVVQHWNVVKLSPQVDKWFEFS